MTDPIGPVATIPYGPGFDPLEGLRVGFSQQQKNAQALAMDPEAFLHLLVAQLQYQDPTDPADMSDFMNQTAMLSQVQSIDTMASAVFEMITAQQTSTATSMIGKAITFRGADGKQASGVVTSVSMHDGVPLLHVGDVGVPLSGVLEVTEPVVGDAPGNTQVGDGAADNYGDASGSGDDPVGETDDNDDVSETVGSEPSDTDPIEGSGD